MKKIKFNSLVLWFKTKLNMMKYAAFYLNEVAYQKKTFDLIEEYVKMFNEHTPGYVFSDNRKENSLDLTIGSEKFTILSNIGKDLLVFDVFGWVFDLTSLTRYSHLKIDSLTFLKKGNTLMFKTTRYVDVFDYTILLDLSKRYEIREIAPLFDVLEDYTIRKDFYNSIKMTSG